MSTTTRDSLTPTRSADPAGYDGRAQPPAPRSIPRPGARRRVLLFVLSILVMVMAIAGLSLSGAKHPPATLPVLTESPTAAARTDAVAFLGRYVLSNGRVSRLDQGGDTVSEGQSYAMLLAVAIARQRTFARVWHWTASHIQESDGLLAYHWRNGHVISYQPATDADLDAAWALLLAARRFHNPAYRTASNQIANGILTNDIVTVSGEPILTAGPWATTIPAVVNPSYLSPNALTQLATASGNPIWSTIAADDTGLNTSVINPGLLPPNWLLIEPDGRPIAVGTSSGSGSPTYGLDAERLPIWDATSCSSATRALAANLWPTFRKLRGRGSHLGYTLNGRSLSKKQNPVGYVAAAAAAAAAGQFRSEHALLAAADVQAVRKSTYYGNAWVALGRVLLSTDWLGSCGS